MTLQPGIRLGSYEITSLLGSGGMGEVYRAKDHKLGRDVAIKVLREELASDPERLRRFEQEARSASALNHPNIITIHDIGKHKSTPYIAMEYVEGKTLRELLAEGPLTTKKLLQLATQIAEGLAKAHGAGIVHRDLKPENLMVTGDGYVKILDFGLAKLLPQPGADSEAATITKEGTVAGAVMGTASYMSPEQALGKPLDARTDVFSLGAVLYEMATGARPFRGHGSVALFDEILHKSPESPRSLHPEVPGALERVISRALEKEREERHLSAREMLAELKAVWVEAEATTRSRQPSIAVLPFADMSPKKDQDYFCEGMAEEIINALTKVEGLRVAARTSTFQFKGKSEDVGRIGEELKVKTLLEGSVRTAGAKLRVTAQLINVDDGYHLWSERYDRQMEDVFDIQDDIARSIVDALRFKLVRGIQRAKRHTDNVEAYHLVLKGRYYKFRLDFPKAIHCCEQALEEDPSYSLAFADLAVCYCDLGRVEVIEPKIAFQKAKDYVGRALSFDKDLGEAHVALGLVQLWYDWDWNDAEREFKRALELSPSYMSAYFFYALLLSNLDRQEEAVAMMGKAVDLDPLNPGVRAASSTIHLYARNYVKVQQECSKALEIDPNHVWALWMLGLSYSLRSMHDEAIAELQKVTKLSHRLPLYLAELGWAYGRANRRAEAERIIGELEERSQREYVSPFCMALVWGGLAEMDTAFEWLGKARDERSSYLPELKVTPLLDSFCSDPRFQDLLRRMNLPE
jgi:serine/threonine-protein kinase